MSSREFLIDWVPWVPNRLEKFVVIGVNTASAFKFGLESFGVELYQWAGVQPKQKHAKDSILNVNTSSTMAVAAFGGGVLCLGRGTTQSIVT